VLRHDAAGAAAAAAMTAPSEDFRKLFSA
jgi:hypothetical protein